MTSASRLIVFQGPPRSGKRCRLISEYRGLDAAERARSVFLTVSDGACRELDALLRSDGGAAPAVWTLARLPREVMRAFGVEPPEALNEAERRIAIASLCRRHSGERTLLGRWASAASSVAADVAALVGLLQRYLVSPEEFHAWTEERGSDAVKAAAVLFNEYCRLQTDRNIADFDRRNVLALELLSRNRPESLPRIVFLDQGQEIDALQARLIAALAGPEGRVLAAVDTWQRSQMYRGAVPDAAKSLAEAMGVEPSVAGPGEVSSTDDAIVNDGYLGALGNVLPSPSFILGASREDQYDRVAEAIREMSGTTAILARSNTVAQEWSEALAGRGFVVADRAPAVVFVGRFLRDALTVLAEDEGSDSDLPARKRAAALRLLDLRGHDTSSERRNRKANDVPPAMAAELDEARKEATLARQIHHLALWTGWVRCPEACAARAYGRAMETLARREEISALAGDGVLTAAGALRDIETLMQAGTAAEERSRRRALDADTPDEAEPVARSAVAVDVLTVHSAVGRRWDNVIIVELEDGRFPQHAVSSPWFSPSDAAVVSGRLADRTQAGVSLGRFERSEEKTVEEERRLFLTAITCGTNITLSCHIAEEDRELAPSPYLLQMFQAHPVLAEGKAQGECYLQDFLPKGRPPVRCGACGRGPCAAGGESGGPEIVREPASKEASSGPEGTPALPDAVLSASGLNDWLYCPRRYLLNRVLGLDEAEGDSLAGGNLVHKAMEAFHRGEDRTPEALERCVEEAATNQEIVEAFSSAAALEMAVSRAKAAGRIYLANRSYDGIAIASEEVLETVEIGGHQFRVKMDAVFRHADDTLEIVDYKSGAAKDRPSDLRKVQPQVDADGNVTLPEKDDADVQMSLYAVAKRGDDLKAVTHEYLCLKKPGDSRPITLEVTEGPPGLVRDGFTTGDLEALEGFFADEAAKVKATKRFLPVPRLGECGRFGFPCPFVAVCDREEGSDA